MQEKKGPTAPPEFREGEIAKLDAAGLIGVLKNPASSEFQKAKAGQRLGEVASKEAVPALALENHMKELVRCIRTRQRTAAHAAAVANTHVVCHAAFIAYQRGKTLTWDPATKAFTNDAVANNMRSRAMREPWRL